MEDFKFGPIQEKWLKSLEENPDRQMTLYLGARQSDGSYKACCLGELGIIAGICEWGNYGELVSATGNNKTLSGYEKVGLYNASGVMSHREDYCSLSEMNDSGLTWPEIAAKVRANPTQFFTKSV